jgi:hypothetical protein
MCAPLLETSPQLIRYSILFPAVVECLDNSNTILSKFALPHQAAHAITARCRRCTVAASTTPQPTLRLSHPPLPDWKPLVFGWARLGQLPGHRARHRYGPSLARSTLCSYSTCFACICSLCPSQHCSFKLLTVFQQTSKRHAGPLPDCHCHTPGPGMPSLPAGCGHRATPVLAARKPTAGAKPTAIAKHAPSNCTTPPHRCMSTRGVA